MDTKIQEAPKIKRETKNRIRVEFDRAPLKERLKAKLLSGYFIGNIIWFLFRFIILLGVSFVIIYPFITKIAGSFMSQDDFIDECFPISKLSEDSLISIKCKVLGY